ncbi:hypothetical protein MMC20_004672 [Loxospora ochrophaea]|nr:hypothetical protein [Loxospora ochrophaea]
MPSIESVFVRKPLCQVRKVDCDAEKNNIEPPEVMEVQGGRTVIGENFQIISSESREAGPVVLSHGDWDLDVRVTGLSHHTNGIPYRVEALGNKFSMSSAEKPLHGQDLQVFPLSIRQNNGTVPGGFKGNMKWTLSSSDGSSEELGLTDLEIYWLPFETTSELPTYLTQIGIPATILRMFIPNLCNTSEPFIDRQQWVKWVVEIVHGTRKPETFEPQLTSEHWLKYDVYGGGYSFCGEAAQFHDPFDIDGWVNAYHKSDKGQGVYSLVNCYDQAGAAEIILSLGYPYHWITWEYHQVYGFIKEVSLVGRGQCNSPYYGDDISLKIFNDQTQKLDERRTLFRNHAYLSIGEIEISERFFEANPNPLKWEEKSKTKRHIVDACAGPHWGEVDRDQYTVRAVESRSDVVDSGRLQGDKNDAGRWVTKDMWAAGITGTKHQKKAAHTEPLKQFEYAPDLERFKLEASNGKVEVSQSWMDEIFKLAVIKNKVVADPKNNVEAEPDFDYHFKSIPAEFQNGTKVTTHEAFIPGYIESTYKSTVITECKNGELAIEKLKSRASLLTPKDGEVEKTSKTNAAFGSVKTKVWGTPLLNMFVYRNLLVEIQKLTGYANAILITIDVIKALETLPVDRM